MIETFLQTFFSLILFMPFLKYILIFFYLEWNFGIYLEFFIVGEFIITKFFTIKEIFF